ncbi:hypothetical protein, partial [Pseudorhodoplanes sp.]|uniref:hypothetical protein n=1 Tax=Pseudorhodoplanes sp. TaxID=1934341 RepID=UPI003D14EC21
MMQWPGIDANRTVAASLAKARRMASACVALALLAPAVTRAAELGECGELNRIENLVDPVKSYADGRIRLAHVSTGGEPVCCSSHLLVLIDAEDRS